MKLRNTLIACLVVMSTSLIAQEESVNLKNRPSSLEVGLAPLALAQENSFGLNLSLAYRKVLSDHLTLSLEGLYSPTSERDVFGDVSSRGSASSRSYYDIEASLSLDLRYFLKENVQEGHYFGLRVNNLLTYTEVSEDLIASTRSFQGSEFKSLPMLGFYYGYRKNLRKNFFVDASVGVNPHQQPFRDLSISNREVFDFRFTLGYTIPFGK